MDLAVAGTASVVGHCYLVKIRSFLWELVPNWMAPLHFVFAILYITRLHTLPLSMYSGCLYHMEHKNSMRRSTICTGSAAPWPAVVTTVVHTAMVAGLLLSQNQSRETSPPV